jgi:hypothetical protein
MALAHSPKIVTDGLVFYYDMGNPQKSWKGAPTANRVVTIPYASNVYTACSGPISAVVTDADGQHRTVNRYTITSTGGVPRARIVATGLTTGVNYTYSLKIKYNGSGTAQSYYIDSSKGNPETNNNSFASRTVTSTPIGNGWYQIVESFVFSACPTGGSWSNFGLSAPNSSYLNQTFDAYDIQFEQQPFATPFVNGTRSNTQAILDLTNNNTVTATSLTYASDGTFSFNGSNYLTVPFTSSLFTFNNEQTILIWMKNEASVAARRNPYNQAYGGAGTITHENNTNFNYFYGTSGVNNSPYTSHTSPFSVTLNETAQIAITRNVSQTAWYKNGTLGNTRANPYGGTVVTGTSPILLGTGYTTGVIGRLYTVQIYNRALTAQEIQQNFNAVRGRFGI